MNLEAKAATARERLSAAFDRFAAGGADLARVPVAWTGGKDSTLVLHLWRELLHERLGSSARPAALMLDTGYKFQEIIAFRDSLALEWGVELTVVRPGDTAALTAAGIVPAGDAEACCRALKIEPLKRAARELGARAMLTGLRRDEHPSRAERSWLERRENPEYYMVNPIIEFTEMDIWSYVMEWDLPYCELYDQGYRSLGCAPCTDYPVGGAERSGRSGDKEAILPRLRSLGYF